MRYDSTKIDPGALPLVDYFNAHGLTTDMSCQGHNDTNESMFWIEFDSSIEENQIIRFQQEHLNEIGSFTSNGRFAMRVFLSPDDHGQIKAHRSWNYFAATLLAAMGDLKDWLELEQRRG